jgi:hypothetical protein
MLLLHTQATIEGVEAPVVLKVVTLEEVAQKGWQLEQCVLWISEDGSGLCPPSVFSLPWGACITRVEGCAGSTSHRQGSTFYQMGERLMITTLLRKWERSIIPS